MQLICPAGSLPALKAAIDHGADGVYIGFRNASNARNFPGLNFDLEQAKKGLAYAHAAGAWVLLAINTFPNASLWPTATRTIDEAVDLGINALIMADPGLLKYTSENYPHVRLHLSVQGSATTHQAIELYRKEFGIVRAVLPRVLSIKQVQAVLDKTDVEIEVFGFGSLCVMVEGRCYLSSYVTGESPNTAGVCSPAKAVTWHEQGDVRMSRLNKVLIDRYQASEPAGYPTLCKGRFEVNEEVQYALEQPTSLNILDILPDLYRMGVAAVKVEGRQRSPAYVAKVTNVMRQAIDSCKQNPDQYMPKSLWLQNLDSVSEGSRHTLGAYDRPWQ